MSMVRTLSSARPKTAARSASKSAPKTSRSLRSTADLVGAGLIEESSQRDIESVARKYAVAITPAMAKLIDRTDKNDPIARQFAPDLAELTTAPNELLDPIGDEAHSPVEGVVHRYPDRVLLKLLHACAVYCRFCFRRETVGPGGASSLSPDAFERALGYIADHPQIWEVILTGGDPLTMSPRRISEAMRALARIEHVKIVRIHTRIPVVDPARIDSAMIDALKSGGQTVYVALHANHPRELSPLARAAVAALVDAGVPMLSQTVLLKGVNDDEAVLADLMRAFVENRIKPYYLHHPDLAPGTAHLRVDLARGRELVAALRGRVSGVCQPEYVLDIPGGYGKVPVGPSYLESGRGGGWRVTDPNGRKHDYADAGRAEEETLAPERRTIARSLVHKSAPTLPRLCSAPADSFGDLLLSTMLRHVLAPLCALFFTFAALGSVAAQQPPQTPAQTPAQTLDTVRSSLDRIEKALVRPDLNDSALLDLRAELEPLSASTEAILKVLEPRLEATKARLEQLGKAGDKPAPDATTPEGQQAAAERAEQQKLFDELDAMVKRARLHSVQAEQLTATIVNRRRALFQQTLLARSASLLSPHLWYTGLNELPGDASAMGYIARDWSLLVSSRLSGSRFWGWLGGNILLIAGVLISLVAARRVMGRPRTLAQPTPLQKTAGAVWVAVVTATVPIVAALTFIEIARFYDLINIRLEPVVSALFDAVRRVSVAVGLARGLLAVDRPQWRLLDLETATAEKLSRLVFTVAVTVSSMKIIEAMNDLVAASVSVSVIMRGVGALIVAFAMAKTLYGILAREDEEEAEYGPRITTGTDWYSIWRVLSWAAIVTIVLACAVGFVALASFVVDQVVWITFVATAGFLIYALATEAIARAIQPGSVAGRAAMNTVGLARGSLRQIATLLQGVLALVLTIVCSMLILAPWGVESDDMFGTLRTAFFGFKVGDITISLSGILLAIGLFAAGTVFTRVLQTWLEDKYLPTTRLDPGLRNSIRASVGYVGIFLAAAMALGYMGLSFDKLAIVAGALSVGIGFGLQAIVGNFVSGLILLWERVIRVGDLIAVGNDTGHVRRINVRSTEIETSDRVTVIVPNSNLITGVVKNWVRSDRVSRVRVPIAVMLTASPEVVRSLLIEVANEHSLVLDQPEPSVAFIAMTDTALKFELSCYAADVEKASRIKSDLNFAIFARLQERGIGPAAT